VSWQLQIREGPVLFFDHFFQSLLFYFIALYFSIQIINPSLKQYLKLLIQRFARD